MEQSNLLGTHWVVGVPYLELSTTGLWVSVSAPPKMGPKQGLFRGAAPLFWFTLEIPFWMSLQKTNIFSLKEFHCHEFVFSFEELQVNLKLRPGHRN